jgi:DNA-binding Lrp family transcriptional regulator
VVNAFVLVEAEPASIAELAERLLEIDGVTEVYSVAGDLADLVVVVRVREHEQLADVVTRHIAAAEGIVSTTTLIAFRAYSKHDLEAAWDLGPA